jgi:hypothetical protein
MTTDATLRLHNITCKTSLWYGNENLIINKRVSVQQVEVAQIIFVRPSLYLTRLDHQRNPDIHKRLTVQNIVRVEYIKLYQKKWLDHLERMDRSLLPKLAFQYKLRGRRDVGRPRRRWRDQEYLGPYIGAGFKTLTILRSRL